VYGKRQQKSQSKKGTFIFTKKTGTQMRNYLFSRIFPYGQALMALKEITQYQGDKKAHCQSWQWAAN
tara:strand:+ start:24185 stop:24385 length:201 start_codon:yes stop_codon:yes gene_type:complete